MRWTAKVQRDAGFAKSLRTSDLMSYVPDTIHLWLGDVVTGGRSARP